jgi:hypothetical protein
MASIWTKRKTLPLLHATLKDACHTLIIGRPPAEADTRRSFLVSGPAAHRMVVGLDEAGLNIERAALPELRRDHDQPVKTSMPVY